MYTVNTLKVDGDTVRSLHKPNINIAQQTRVVRCDSTTQEVNVKAHMFAQVAAFCEGIILVFTVRQAPNMMNALRMLFVCDRITIDYCSLRTVYLS